ncbi:uncharacterized protein BP5553_09845 [Venustampulla echinocandica]|uniref:Uncharacterized protein n=1 Tax=Venustampulla echinocandica TaxID=2656787 RepID=A0A370TAU0_9HELO|nr:uncharacterized protein BP5553_09845 [Venustampulla echinocandica]RDL31056.1 hypothetical protein BP5553_09845 [Venustampulla echinocandica]
MSWQTRPPQNNSHTKKRRADKPLDTPRPKRAFLGFNLPSFPSIFSSQPSPSDVVAEAEIQEESEASDPPAPPPLTREERQRKIAAYVDAQFDAEAERVADATLKDPNRKLNWQPDIKPTDEEWKTKRVYFHEALTKASIKDVLQKDFEEAQELLLQPSRRAGSTQKIQTEHTEIYKEALGPQGAFHGTKNNLATKLTMLHFGLPVEPMGAQNMLNAGLDLDADDPEEEPEGRPRVQRIFYAAKPLQFLDDYHERSHGFPMLRRPKAKENPMTQQLPSFPLGTASGSGDIPKTRPIYPGATTVGMRGGAGPVQNIYLYGPNKGRVTCASTIDSHEPHEFVCRALGLLNLDPSSEWEFEVDQYDDQDSLKTEKYKPLVQSFMINKFTNQDQWTKHLRRLVCEPNGDWAMVVDHPRPLGVVAPKTFEPPEHDFIPPPSPTTQGQVPDLSRRLSSVGRKTSLPAARGWPPLSRSIGNPPSGAGSTKATWSPHVSSLGFGQAAQPRINEEKLLAARAASAKIPKFDPWMAEQSRLDRLKRESWYKDHSVVEPGQKPEPPLFSASRELAFTVGDAMPTIYSQRLTPTDLGQLLEENQSLRNKVLDRMDNCPMCDVTFPNYETNQITAHFKMHADQIASAGVCPECESEQWTFMNTEQRRDHLASHRDQNESDMISNFWNKFDCPVCDMPLGRHPNTQHPQDILDHVAGHTPGAIQFCDRCGIDIKQFTPIEHLHHKNICIDGPKKDLGDPDPLFCDACGKDRTDEQEEGLMEHRRYCHRGPGKFCNLCGLNLSSASGFLAVHHKNRCRPPRGFRKKFCRRCGANLPALDENGRLAHREACHFIEPRPGAQDGRTTGLRGEIPIPAAATDIDADVKRQSKHVMDRATELDQRETRIKAREAAINKSQQQAFGSGREFSVAQLESQNTLQDPLDTPVHPLQHEETFPWASDSQQESADEGASDFDVFGKFTGGMNESITSKAPAEAGISDNNARSTGNEQSLERKRKRTSKGKTFDPLYRYEEDSDEDDEADLEHVEPEYVEDLLSQEKKKKKKRVVGVQKDPPYRYSPEDEVDEEIERGAMQISQEVADEEKAQKQTKKKSPAIKPTPTAGGRALRGRTSSSTPAPSPPTKTVAGKGRKMNPDKP